MINNSHKRHDDNLELDILTDMKANTMQVRHQQTRTQYALRLENNLFSMCKVASPTK